MFLVCNSIMTITNVIFPQYEAANDLSHLLAPLRRLYAHKEDLDAFQANWAEVKDTRANSYAPGFYGACWHKEDWPFCCLLIHNQ